MSDAPERTPLIRPLGDQALLVRFAAALDDRANRAAIAFAALIEHMGLPGVTEVAANLVSVLLRYDPTAISYEALAGEVRLALGGGVDDAPAAKSYLVHVRYGGEFGPDLDEVASRFGMSANAFVAAHSAATLRVLATGFAPGFVYCGFHAAALDVPRRTEVRQSVPAGTVLFAARQTAITATTIPTGWHVIGRTDFANFEPDADPPTILRAGDTIAFEALA